MRRSHSSFGTRVFVSLHFPIFDARGLFLGRDRLVARPAWPAPDISAEPFQRNLGAVRDRPLGGLRGWAAESAICEVGRSLRINPLHLGVADAAVRPAFKRFHADGEGGAQFSVGFPIPLDAVGTPEQRGEVVRAILETEIRSRHDPKAVPLADAGGQVARLFAAGTTRGNRPGADVGLVSSGRPLILVQGPRLGRAGSGGEAERGRIVQAGAIRIQDATRELGTAPCGSALLIERLTLDARGGPGGAHCPGAPLP